MHPKAGTRLVPWSTPIFTEGESPDEIEANARDAVRCHFEEGDLPKVIPLHYVRDDVIAV